MADTTTGLDLISASMKLIGVLAQGETAKAEESADALDRLNDILETWRLNRLMVYNVSRQMFPLTANLQLHTIGVGGTFNVERPLWLDDARVVFNHGTASQYELPLPLLTDQEWGDVSLKAMASTFPSKVWFNQNYPLGELYFWPIQTDATLYVSFLMPMVISSAVTLSTVLALPPGYRKALRYELAVELAQEFGRQLNPMVLKIARETKAAIMGQNGSPVELRCDPAITGGSGRWSIFDGGFGRR